MKNSSIRKLFAVLMSVALLVGILAGCGAEQSVPDTTGAANPVVVGMLVLNANASVYISYDADGHVLDIQGADENGENLVGEHTDFLGKSCSDVVADLIKSSAVVGSLNDEVNYIIIKQAFNSALPSTAFLETVLTAAQAAATEAGSAAKVILITTEDLDADGYIGFEMAKKLLLAHLGQENVDTLDGTPELFDGMYGFTVVAGENRDSYIVNAVTGDVFEGVLEGTGFEDGYTDIDESPDENVNPGEDTIGEQPPVE